MNESCLTYAWVMSHMWMSHATQMVCTQASHLCNLCLRPRMRSSHSFRLKSAQRVVKSLRTYHPVQIIMYQVHLRLYIKTFFKYSFEPIYRLNGNSNTFSIQTFFSKNSGWAGSTGSTRIFVSKIGLSRLNPFFIPYSQSPQHLHTPR